MNQGFSAASCVSHQAPRFVWISDALLADTFTRFCHHKRYGSSVPGPLEAQRRATRRKNTSLAHYGQENTGIDPSVVLGGASKINWWQAPANPDGELSGSRILPSWLFSDSNPARKNTRNPGSTFDTAGNQISQLQKVHEFDDEQVKRCKSLVEIRTWLKELGVSVRGDKRIGETISQHLLAGGFRGSEIAAYLCDPAFHPHGTSFHLQMLPDLLNRTWDFWSWHAIRDSYCKATELGLLGVEDLRAVISLVADAGTMRFIKEDGKLQIVRTIEKEHLIHGLLTSLANSRVLKLDDLGGDFLSRLLRKVGNTKRLTATSQRILWDLSPWASELDASLISRLIMIQLRARCRENPDEEVGKVLAKRLAKVPSKALQLSLLQTTDGLIRIAQENASSIYVYLLHHWTGTLEILGSTKEAPLMTEDIWATYSSSTSSLNIGQRLLAFSWVALCLGKCRRKSPILSERLDFLDAFEQTLKSIPELDESGLLGRAILAIGTLPLPHKHLLLQHLSRIANRDPLPAAPDSESAPHMDLLRHRSFSLFLDHDMYEKAQVSHHDVLIELAESLNHDLPLFKMLAQRMILKSPLSFEIISRILDNNVSFKLALSQASPQRLHAVQQGAQPTVEALFKFIGPLGETGDGPTNHSDILTNSSGIPSPAEALDLINHLAVCFATSTVTSPRASLRRVYWCYMFLHRYGGPVQPTMTRALWYVGVTRYGESGTSRTLLRWILWQVKQIEGEDVARHLLWSQSIREQLRRDLENLSKVDALEEKQLLVELATSADVTPPSHSQDVPTSTDLETLQRIRFAKTEPEEPPFFFEKVRRRADWEQAQARKAKA